MTDTSTGSALGMRARLLYGSTLVGTVEVDGPSALRAAYQVKGAVYRTISYMERTDSHDRRWLDVQVAPVRSRERIDDSA